MQNNSSFVDFSQNRWHLCMLLRVIFSRNWRLFYQFKILLHATILRCQQFYKNFSFMELFVTHLLSICPVNRTDNYDIRFRWDKVWLHSRFTIFSSAIYAIHVILCKFYFPPEKNELHEHKTRFCSQKDINKQLESWFVFFCFYDSSLRPNRNENHGKRKYPYLLEKTGDENT